MITSKDLSLISDEQLISNLETLSIRENETTVEILLHLWEVEKRKLYLEAGFSSLFSYCVQGRLCYSEPAANRRICSARALSQFPELVSLLLGKELSLSTLCLASGILTAENKEEVIAGIRGKTRRQVEEFLAGYRPKTEIRERVKPVAVIKAASKRAVASTPLFDIPQEPHGSFSGECAKKRSETECEVQEQRYELRFSFNAEAFGKLEEAKSLLSGKYPKGVRLEDVFEEALELLLEKRSPKRRNARREKRKPKEAPAKQRSTGPKVGRHIPQKIRDQVYRRDQGCCGFIGQDGQRCASRFDLEVHHINAYARGGSNQLDNLALRCRAHNLHEAERDFGKGFIASCQQLAVGSELNRLGEVSSYGFTG